MKIFYMGDIHGAWGDADAAYDEAVEKHGEPDLLIQVGDFGYYPYDPPANIEEFDPYHTYPRARKGRSGLWERTFNHPVEFIDGNHEMHDKLFKAHAASNDGLLHGYKDGVKWRYRTRGEYEDGRLYVGGAHSVDKAMRLRQRMHWSDQEQMEYGDFQAIMDADHKDVKTLICHTCPSQIDMQWACAKVPSFVNDRDEPLRGEDKKEKSRSFLGQIGDKYEPDFVIFGHWHKSSSGLAEWSSGKKFKWKLLKICEIVCIEE